MITLERHSAMQIHLLELKPEHFKSIWENQFFTFVNDKKWSLSLQSYSYSSNIDMSDFHLQMDLFSVTKNITKAIPVKGRWNLVLLENLKSITTSFLRVTWDAPHIFKFQTPTLTYIM